MIEAFADKSSGGEQYAGRIGRERIECRQECRALPARHPAVRRRGTTDRSCGEPEGCAAV